MPRKQTKWSSRAELIVSRRAQSLLQKYDLQLELLAERVVSEFDAERRLVRNNGPTDRICLKYLALLALDYESYVSVAFDLGKLIDALCPHSGFPKTAIYQEIREMRTDVRHAHEPLKSNTSTWIQVSGHGVCLRWNKRRNNAFMTRTFQEVHRDLTAVRLEHDLTGEGLVALVRKLDQEKRKIEFPDALPPQIE